MTAKEREIHIATVLANLTTQLSSHINSQDLVNQRVLTILENDDKIGKIGIVNRVDHIDERLTKIETRNKITAGKLVTASGIFAFLGAVGWKLFDFIIGMFDK